MVLCFANNLKEVIFIDIYVKQKYMFITLILPFMAYRHFNFIVMRICFFGPKRDVRLYINANQTSSANSLANGHISLLSIITATESLNHNFRH